MPLPEPHLAGLAVGILAQRLHPWTLLAASWPGHVLGWPLVLGGLALAAWAVRAAGAVDLAGSGSLVVHGPYARSRNPMYVAWTSMYLGVALVVNSAWLMVVSPAVLAWTHLVVRREERALGRRFGDAYAAYASRTPRYV